MHVDRMLRSLPHGHVAAALGVLRKLKLDRVLSQGGRQPAREVSLSIAMNVARLLDPVSKLATARLLDAATANCSLGAVLGFTAVDEQELYDALDWLVEQQERIESALARRHLKNGTLMLYDVTSTYFEGRTCPLAKFGHDRDGKGKLQIVFGLLCTAEGCPVAVEVFEGNVGDPTTLPSQISKIKERFELERVVLVGDRGMIIHHPGSRGSQRHCNRRDATRRRSFSSQCVGGAGIALLAIAFVRWEQTGWIIKRRWVRSTRF